MKPNRTLKDWQDKAASLHLDGRPFVDGQRVEALTDETFEVVNPQTGQRLATLPACGSADVDRAVASARRAFSSGSWSDLAPYERSQILRRYGELIVKHGEELGLLDALQMGAPISSVVCNMQMGDEIAREVAALSDKLHDQALLSAPTALALNVHQPQGVVAAISPWNAPVHVALMKALPALSVGNTVVLKPSELAPLACLRLAELALQAGVPAGVFNVLPGLGPQAGRALALHMDVDFLSFTGSTTTGLQLMQCAGQSNMKGLVLECGGKSAQLVFDDVGDIDALADALVQSFTLNSGQVCSAHSRILVADALYDRLLPLLAARVQATTTGHPLDPATTLGPLASASQHARVTHLLGQARSTDRLVASGQACGGSPYVLAPQLYESTDDRSPLMQEEIFGPVASVMRFSGEAQALALANGTRYGLAGTVWTRDFMQARRVLRRLRAGFVVANAVARPASAWSYYMTGEPVGMSGFGAAAGAAGLLVYTRVRQHLYQLA
jgi:acyl-CoA reductase-like NAD-dependent aldehyde dehydrogenase